METSKLEKTADTNENIAKVVKQLSDNLEEFIYAVSHDLKTPLIPILGFSDLLKKRFGSDLPEKALKYIDRIQKNAHKLEQYLESLLRLSRIGRNIDTKKPISEENNDFKPPLEEKIRLNTLINRNCAEYLNAAEKLGVSIEINENCTIPFKHEFNEITDELFKEIISNAIKFQYQPNELNAETLSENQTENQQKKFIKIYNVEPSDPHYDLIMSFLLGTDDNGQNSIQNSVYINPVLISDLTAQDAKLDKELKNPEIICIEDNGIGFNSESWKELLRVFNISNNPNSLYDKSLKSENTYFKDLFSIFAEPIGIGFPIIQKICRIGGISAIVESIPVDKMKNSIQHGTKFYLIFPLTS